MKTVRGKMPGGQDYVVETDGVTVWVNGASCLGRFGKFGPPTRRNASLGFGRCPSRPSRLQTPSKFAGPALTAGRPAPGWHGRRSGHGRAGPAGRDSGWGPSPSES